jgi:NADPH2:quinone reductase
MAAIQLAKALGGRVMTTVGSEEKADFVRRLGADIVVNWRREELVAVMESHPVSVALDCVGGPDLGRCIEKMTPGGRWIVIATMGGAKTELDMNLFFRRGFKLIAARSAAGHRGEAKILSALEERCGPVSLPAPSRPVVYKVLPITKAEEAHALLQKRENLGKVVLAVCGLNEAKDAENTGGRKRLLPYKWEMLVWLWFAFFLHLVGPTDLQQPASAHQNRSQ